MAFLWDLLYGRVAFKVGHEWPLTLGSEALGLYRLDILKAIDVTGTPVSGLELIVVSGAVVVGGGCVVAVVLGGVSMLSLADSVADVGRLDVGI